MTKDPPTSYLFNVKNKNPPKKFLMQVEGDKARCIAVRCGAVADPQGLEVWEEEEELLCLAVGVGMEITSFTDLALDNSK